jgi:tetratricopeptide (TPR) repeat protein
VTARPLALLVLCRLTAAAADPEVAAQELYRGRQWGDVVALWRESRNPPAALDYYAGMSLARLGNPRDASKALEAGYTKSPLDKRFPTELAGLAFERKDLSAAKTYLVSALRLDPRDAYANDFLGSLYFLEHNLEAALRYWNRIGKPRVEQIRMEPDIPGNPLLIHRALAMTPAALLELDQLRTTKATLDLLGLGAGYGFELEPRQEDQRFDLLFRAPPVDGKVDRIVSTLRGLPYQTLYPEFDLGRGAGHVSSLLRFDRNKLRVFAAASAPAGGDPRQRLQVYVDARREIWDLSRSLQGGSALTGVRLDKIEAGGEFRSVVDGTWSWSAGLSLSDRRYGNARLNPAAAAFFSDGVLLKSRARLDRTLLRIPEKNLTITASANADLGRLFAPGFGTFQRVGGSVEMRWLPSGGRKYELRSGLRSAKTFGPVPLDELFMLGLERDIDLPLAAHIGTDSGKKGNAPLGRAYFLTNLEFSRTVYTNAFLNVKLGPILDTGRISDPSGVFGSRKWLVDTGAQLRIGILGSATLVLSYGKDLRGGRNALYATALR